jgi:hypothetical protein
MHRFQRTGVLSERGPRIGQVAAVISIFRALVHGSESGLRPPIHSDTNFPPVSAEMVQSGSLSTSVEHISDKTGANCGPPITKLL